MESIGMIADTSPFHFLPDQMDARPIPAGVLLAGLMPEQALRLTPLGGQPGASRLED